MKTMIRGGRMLRVPDEAATVMSKASRPWRYMKKEDYKKEMRQQADPNIVSVNKGHCYHNVYDAHGNCLDYVVWANLETGEAEHYKMHYNKQHVLNKDGEPVMEIRKHPAPMRIEKIEDKEEND